jgi:hypothetical protein
MLGKAVFVAGTVIVGVMLFQQYQANKKADCLVQVARFQRAYTSDRPKSESGPSDLRNRAPNAEKACHEGRYADASRILTNARLICRLNNGCAEKRTN